jgi:hypothetical protein
MNLQRAPRTALGPRGARSVRANLKESHLPAVSLLGDAVRNAGRPDEHGAHHIFAGLRLTHPSA